MVTIAFVLPLRVFPLARFYLHAQRDECYVHVMSRSRLALAALKSVDIGRRSLSKRVGVSKSVKKCVTRVRKVQGKEKGQEKPPSRSDASSSPACRNSIHVWNPGLGDSRIGVSQCICAIRRSRRRKLKEEPRVSCQSCARSQPKLQKQKISVRVNWEGIKKFSYIDKVVFFRAEIKYLLRTCC